MLNIPSKLTPYLSKINQFNRAPAIEIQFSGPTYQVKVDDPSYEEPFWTFIQLDSKGNLRDAFCSCEESEISGGCVHLALSYIHLFDERQKPVHELFLESFWRAMGEVWFSRYGAGAKRKGFKAFSKTDAGRQVLDLIKGKKVVETEENSIKFSNLSEQELDAWKEGHPSKELLFELSGWSDFAKQLMLMAKEEPAKIVFKETNYHLPQEVSIIFEDLEIMSSLDPEDFLLLIPTLDTLSSNLKIHHHLVDGASSITYDQDRQALIVQVKKAAKKEASHIVIGDFEYRASEGFYPIQGFLTSWGTADSKGRLVLSGDAIESFFNRYGPEISKVLKGARWHEEAVELKFALGFDKGWNLKISPYIQDVSDLGIPKTMKWGKWVFIPDAGFFSVKNPEVFDVPSLVPKSNVEDFISTHADWLNQQAGFHLHEGSVETHLSYRLDAQGALVFMRKMASVKEGSKEFGRFVYVKGEGFFHKGRSPVILPIQVEVPLGKDLIPSFIRRHKDELEKIPGFILKENPFAEIGLDIGMDKKKRIFVEPKVTLKPQFALSIPKFYDEWVFLEGLGFFEIPVSERLPERASLPFWVAKENVKEFIEKELPALQPWVRKMDPQLVPPAWARLVLDKIEEASYNSWKLHLHYQTDRGHVAIKRFIETLAKKEKNLFLPEGFFDLSEGRFQWIRRLSLQTIQEDGSLLFSTIELLRLQAFEEIAAVGPALDLLKEILDLKRVPPFDCSELKSVLRPYQKTGAEWLFSLCTYLLGGLLCDEMGLGKTHQSMALIAALRKINPKAKFLVVCPTSVLYHWEDKLQEFFPTLKTITYHGMDRKTSREKDFSLFLTSYGMLRTDIEWLKKHPFDVAFYDEIQVAKNHRSKLYLAMSQVAADVKIGLTGTPLENRLRELKALFDLVLPGYMPQESEYQKRIVRPIEKMRDMHQKSFLQRLTHPFILRRRKMDVLRDLPEKTETVVRCELSPYQDRLYRETLLMQQHELMQQIQDVKKPVPFLHVFSLLSRLKQICDHPALYFKQPDAYQKFHSGKWDLFLELLEEARASEQKIVVYSQYLGMLDIIENYLKSAGIGYASLRGSTRDRKEQIDLFSKDPACEVFVASLKAAGLGIDLTAASVVIHYDRWWNAARENQATDRVHRYGQSRGVQVFKLVTKNTFEERIDQIIERKKNLFEEAIAIDDHEVIKSFTRDELFELLQYQEPSA